MNDQHNWYTRIPAQERLVIDATAKWLSPVKWQWFITLTFSWNVRGETADLKLKQWLNTVEREMKARVCFVAGKERKPAFSGILVPWHFHLLITSDVALPEPLLQRTWVKLAGHGKRRPGGDGLVDDRILVESYEHHSLGPQYCLKSMSTCDGDWLFRWLELFNPLMKQTGSPNHIKVRQRARFAAQRDPSHP
jgi:hypothetical protein